MKYLERNVLKNKIVISLVILILFTYLASGIANWIQIPIFEDLYLRLGDFFTFFRSIIIQSFPYLLLGISISTMVAMNIHTFVFKFIRKTLFFVNFVRIQERLMAIQVVNAFFNSAIWKHFYISTFGFLMPVCECGNIPVARRFMIKGFSVSQTITFLLAAPIINPITIFTTYIAFPNSEIVLLRVFLALLIANVIGLLVHKMRNQTDLLTPKFYNEICEFREIIPKNQLKHGLNIFQKEFVTLMGMLIIGSFIASVTQVFVSRDLIVSIGSNILLGIIAMQILAFVVSVCSSVDSFIALSYSNSFTTGAIISFLLLGPMVDIKILTLLKDTFKLKTLILITSLVVLFCTFAGLLVNYFV